MPTSLSDCPRSLVRVPNSTATNMCRAQGCEEPVCILQCGRISGYCSAHQQFEVRARNNKSCKEPGCNKNPHYGVSREINPRSKAEYCSGHKKPGMINIHGRKCLHRGCTKQPRFDYQQGKGKFCADHREHGMRDVLYKPCAAEGCMKHPHFGLEEGGPRYCARHRTDDMVDVKHPRCHTRGCPELRMVREDGHRALRCAFHEAAMSLTCQPGGRGRRTQSRPRTRKGRLALSLPPHRHHTVRRRKGASTSTAGRAAGSTAPGPSVSSVSSVSPRVRRGRRKRKAPQWLDDFKEEEYQESIAPVPAPSTMPVPPSSSSCPPNSCCQTESDRNSISDNKDISDNKKHQQDDLKLLHSAPSTTMCQSLKEELVLHNDTLRGPGMVGVLSPMPAPSNQALSTNEVQKNVFTQWAPVDRDHLHPMSLDQPAHPGSREHSCTGRGEKRQCRTSISVDEVLEAWLSSDAETGISVPYRDVPLAPAPPPSPGSEHAEVGGEGSQEGSGAVDSKDTPRDSWSLRGTNGLADLRIYPSGPTQRQATCSSHERKQNNSFSSVLSLAMTGVTGKPLTSLAPTGANAPCSFSEDYRCQPSLDGGLPNDSRPGTGTLSGVTMASGSVGIQGWGGQRAPSATTSSVWWEQQQRGAHYDITPVILEPPREQWLKCGGGSVAGEPRVRERVSEFPTAELPLPPLPSSTSYSVSSAFSNVSKVPEVVMRSPGSGRLVGVVAPSEPCPTLSLFRSTDPSDQVPAAPKAAAAAGAWSGNPSNQFLPASSQMTLYSAVLPAGGLASNDARKDTLTAGACLEDSGMFDDDLIWSFKEEGELGCNYEAAPGDL